VPVFEAFSADFLGLPESISELTVISVWGHSGDDEVVKSTASIGDRRQNEYTLAESFRTAAKKWKP